MTKEQIAGMIDHTLLAATATCSKIEKICKEAVKYNFASVCINPVNVKFAAQKLSGSNVSVCTVIGFPLGAGTSKTKAFEAVDAVSNGADEVDMVLNIGALKDSLYNEVEQDILEVVTAAKKSGKKLQKGIIVKVILETCYLTDNEIIHACHCAQNAGADFVKTSTGFATPKSVDGKDLPNGATVHAVSLMRKTVGDSMGVKASGGIRNASTASEMVKAGASRIGASSGTAIVEAWENFDK